MRWFRANRKIGGRLALFALALQFYLSFAHIHPEDIFGPTNAPLSDAAQIARPATGVAQLRAADQATNQTDDFCAICETIYLLATSSAPQPPQIVQVPHISQPATPLPAVAGLFVAPQRAPFQSRAPPLA